MSGNIRRSGPPDYYASGSLSGDRDGHFGGFHSAKIGRDYGEVKPKKKKTKNKKKEIGG